MPPTVDTHAQFMESVAAAQAEIDAREGNDPPETESVDPLDSGQEDEIEALASDDQDDVTESEQAQDVLEPPAGEDSEDSLELLGDLESEDEPMESAVPDSFELPGIDEPVSLEELKNGYLRQADYTRKTQELASQRQAAEQADKLYQVLTQNPHALAKQLAVAAGFLEPDAAPVNVVELPFRSAEDIQSEIDQKVAEALESHPDLEAARDLLTIQWMDSEFARIEKEVFEGKTLGEKSRKLILAEADKANTADLELVARALKAKADDKARSSQALKRSAPVKPTGKASQAAVTAEPENFRDAAQLAAEKLGIKLDPSKLSF